MSGFNYHLRCPNCDAVSPTVPFGAPGVLSLIASNTATHEFQVQRIAAPDDKPLRQIAAEASSPALHVSAAIPDGDGLALCAAIPCPRCGQPITRATWGAPHLPAAEPASLDQLIADTRGLVRRGEFTGRGYLIRVIPDQEDGGRVNEWQVRLSGKSDVDLALLTEELRARLIALGCRVSLARLQERVARFTEWPGE